MYGEENTMDDTVLASLRGFGDVWERVTGEAASPGPEDDLRRLMCRAERLIEYLSALSGRLRSAAPRLNRLTDGQRRILRRLRAELYLLTGEVYSPPAACALAAGSLGALRTACLAAGEAADDFADSARRAGSGLSALLDSFSAAERACSRELKELILRAMDANST